MLQGTRDINLDVQRVEGYRHFCNKIWNATKFALGNLGDAYVPPSALPGRADLTVLDRWILSRLNACITKSNQSLTEYHPPPRPLCVAVTDIMRAVMTLRAPQPPCTRFFCTISATFIWRQPRHANFDALIILSYSHAPLRVCFFLPLTRHHRHPPSLPLVRACGCAWTSIPPPTRATATHRSLHCP